MLFKILLVQFFVLLSIVSASPAGAQKLRAWKSSQDKLVERDQKFFSDPDSNQVLSYGHCYRFSDIKNFEAPIPQYSKIMVFNGKNCSGRMFGQMLATREFGVNWILNKFGSKGYNLVSVKFSPPLP
ncbi:hypothetical protein AYI68_g3997 [Smittium mucronatum]|uniref:Uncharacterized protein n=1 Tax=Smittium mucronatum TaxID=133383 RepID=A0A1R0GYC6_9FUNG|nr:hypothetical protein AYI68_g3997 [Smittium mucronatum]